MSLVTSRYILETFELARGLVLKENSGVFSSYLVPEFCSSCGKAIGRLQIIIELRALIHKTTIHNILVSHKEYHQIRRQCCKILFITPFQVNIVDDTDSKIIIADSSKHDDNNAIPQSMYSLHIDPLKDSSVFDAKLVLREPELHSILDLIVSKTE